MKDFVKMLFKKGFMLMLLVFLLWIVFFLINYFYPSVFNFSSDSDKPYMQNFNKEKEIPLRFKIYNLFFKNSIQNPLVSIKNNNIDSTSSVYEYKNLPYIWGDEISTNTIILRDKNKLNMTDYYIYINDENNNITENFKINGNKIKQDEENIFSKGANITGDISSNYLSSYYFSIYIYDANGDFLFSIPASGYFDLKDNDILKISAFNNNYNNYTGDGFMVIWSDNQEVESILISKIKIVI